MYIIYHIHIYIYIPMVRIRSTTRGNPSLQMDPLKTCQQSAPLPRFSCSAWRIHNGVMAMDHLLEPQREKCWWKKQLYIYIIYTYINYMYI